jgi:hypothetical protein
MDQFRHHEKYTDDTMSQPQQELLCPYVKNSGRDKLCTIHMNLGETIKL